jgi:hypothetical protein
MYQVILITDEVYNAHVICQTENFRVAEAYMDAYLKTNTDIFGHVVLYDKGNGQFLQYTI